MNLTIPIRAQNSTSSSSHQLRSNTLVNNRKTDRQRYFVSIIIATVILGSVAIGGASYTASARDNFSLNSFNYTPNTNQNYVPIATNSSSPPTKTATIPTATSPTLLPAETAIVTPAAKVPPAIQIAANTSEQPVATTSSPHTATVTQAPVVAQATRTQATRTQASPVETASQVVEQPTSTLVDTAPESANLTAAQSTKDAQAVNYSSNRLSDDTRNRILMLAGVAAVMSALLYMVSFIGVAKPMLQGEAIPVRNVVPVEDGTTN